MLSRSRIEAVLKISPTGTSMGKTIVKIIEDAHTVLEFGFSFHHKAEGDDSDWEGDSAEGMSEEDELDKFERDDSERPPSRFRLYRGSDTIDLRNANSKLFKNYILWEYEFSPLLGEKSPDSSIRTVRTTMDQDITITNLHSHRILG